MNTLLAFVMLALFIGFQRWLDGPGDGGGDLGFVADRDLMAVMQDH